MLILLYLTETVTEVPELVIVFIIILDKLVQMAMQLVLIIAVVEVFAMTQKVFVHVTESTLIMIAVPDFVIHLV
jgi:hypothetical protein